MSKNDTPFIKRAYNLGLKLVPNIVETITPEQLDYYEQHLDELPQVACRGLAFPQAEKTSQKTEVQVVNPTDKEVFDLWMSKQSEFWEKLGVKPKLDGANVPKEPIGNFCLPIYNPGTMNDQALADKVLKHFRPYWVSVPLMDYSGSEAPGQPSLVLVRNTIEPDKEHLGKSSNDARAYAKKHSEYFLNRQHYIILFSFYVFIIGENLDVKGWTRFPENRLSGGHSADGLWSGGCRGVGFRYGYSDRRCDIAGPREGKFFSL